MRSPEPRGQDATLAPTSILQLPILDLSVTNARVLNGARVRTVTDIFCSPGFNLIAIFNQRKNVHPSKCYLSIRLFRQLKLLDIPRDGTLRPLAGYYVKAGVEIGAFQASEIDSLKACFKSLTLKTLHHISAVLPKCETSVTSNIALLIMHHLAATGVAVCLMPV